MFPVPSPTNTTASLMGGWELAVPLTSIHKQSAWDLLGNHAKTQNTCPIFIG